MSSNNQQQPSEDFFPLTPEGWEEARNVLLGGSNKMSVAAAAEAAGLSRHVFIRCIERSRMRLPNDEPWVYNIAPVFDQRDHYIADAMEDLVFEKAKNGDLRAAVAMLAVRDKRYKTDRRKEKDAPVDAESIRRKLSQEMHLANIQKGISEEKDKDE